MSNKIIKKAAACGLSAVMAFGLVAVTEAPKTANVSAATKKVKKKMQMITSWQVIRLLGGL